MLSEALRLLRVFNDYKASELAKKLNISPSYLSEIEKGKKKPNIDLLDKYSAIFNIRVSTLLFFSEELEKDNKNGIKKAASDKMIKLLKIIEKVGELKDE